ncbi:hypothetical protein H7992_19000 [Sporosarcina sp. resist]|uniref:SF0329 family protein n=1 Tax=Sporosarcina sp. resist TaxID=2762563 RepID=UPI00164EA6CA|nr:hypothetical protein [Sporosarcina sp. resist]QNK87267.1 hypothetical protein H7992_19000 [Sporosarcina sp. resist]
MRWSKLKQMAEGLLCESLKGRVHYQAIIHRKSHDQTSSFRVTFDGKEIGWASDIPYAMELNRRSDDLRDERQLNPFPWHLHWRELELSEDYKAYHRAYEDTETEMIADEVFPAWDVKELLFDYVHMPFEEAIVHEHPFVRAISLFDRRFGKRRLAEIDSEKESGLVKAFYEIRIEADSKE